MEVKMDMKPMETCPAHGNYTTVCPKCDLIRVRAIAGMYACMEMLLAARATMRAIGGMRLPAYHQGRSDG